MGLSAHRGRLTADNKSYTPILDRIMQCASTGRPTSLEYDSMRFQRRNGLLLLLMAAMAVLLLAPAVALARAGGGEGFGGGGGGFGGGGSGGGGALLFELLYFLVLLHPLIGIPLMIVVGVIYYMTHTSVAGYYRGRRTQRGLDAMDSNREAAALASLQQRDPAFQLDRFYQRVQTAFLKIQDAWCAQNPHSVRPFISDGVHERFGLQFLEQKEEGVRDRMENITVQAVQLAQLTSDNVFDTAVVRIDAGAVDQQVSLADARVLSGSSQSEDFTEYWSFLRRRGARSTDKDGLIEGHCPNCGAPIELNAGARCENCHAQLRSGQYDWVLVQITQESEWRPEYPKVLPGVCALEQRDPDFTPADLEDRVSVLFWRKARADRLGKVDPLLKVATPEFTRAYQQLLAAPATGERAFWGDCAVGGVETLGVIPGDGQDQALVEIRWSARRYQVDAQGQARRTPESNLARNLMVLGRKAGVKTDTAAGISSAHCPQCGAPVVDDASDKCGYCGAIFNDGSRGWVLTDMLAMSSAQAQELLMQLARSDNAGPSLPAQGAEPVPANGQAAAYAPPGAGAALPPEPSGLLAWMVKAVVRNRGIDAAQEQMLRAVAKRRNITDEQLHRMIDAAGRGQLQTPEPHSPVEVQQWLGAMVAAALANGDLTTSEQRLINGVGFQYGLSLSDVKILIRREKDMLYTHAVDALRQQRAVAA